MDHGEGLLELVEPLVLAFGEFLVEGDTAEFLDLGLDEVGEGARGIVLGVGDDDGLIAPAQGHEVADPGHFETARLLFFIIGDEPLADVLDDVKAAVHLVVLDERTTENDIRNEDERDDVDGRLGAAHDARDKKSRGDPDKGGEEHPEEVVEKHVPDPEDGVADEQVDDALDEGEEPEGEVFPDDVAADAKAVMPLALEEVAVADDLFGGVGHAEEEGGDESEEEVGGDVEGVREVVGAVFGVAHHHGDEDGKGGGLEQGRGEVGAVPQLAEEGALELVGKADPVVTQFSRRRLRGLLQGRGLRGVRVELAQIDLFEEAVGLEAVGPEGGVETPRGDKVAADVAFEDDIAAEVAQGRLEDVEDEVGGEIDAAVVPVTEGCGAGVDAFLLPRFVEVFEDLRGRPEEGHFPPRCRGGAPCRTCGRGGCSAGGWRRG